MTHRQRIAGIAKFKTSVGIGGEQISVNPDNVSYVIDNGSQGGVYIAFSKDRLERWRSHIVRLRGVAAKGRERFLKVSVSS